MRRKDWGRDVPRNCSSLRPSPSPKSAECMSPICMPRHSSAKPIDLRSPLVADVSGLGG